MGQVATVTSKSMITIPAKIRQKYGFKQGSKLEFIDTEEGILLVPVKTLRELRGAFKSHEKIIRQAIPNSTTRHARNWASRSQTSATTSSEEQASE